MSFVAGHRLIGRCDFMRRREFMLPGAGVTTVEELASLGFSETEHLRSKSSLDVLNSVCAGKALLVNGPDV